MAATAVSYSQLAKLWKITQATILTLMSASGVVPLWQGKNAAGLVTIKDWSNGAREQSGALLVGSGSATLYADPVGRNVGIRTTSPKAALEVAGLLSGQTLTVSTLKNCTVKTDGNGATTCGTDLTGGGSVNTGALLLAAEGRFLNQGGD